MSKKRAYIRKRRNVHLRCRQKAENARKVRSRQKLVQSPEPASVTFQAAATLWHRTNVARYKGATAVKYENLLRSHILPELGARQLEEINTLLLADFMNAKLHCGRLDHSGGLASSYVRSMMLLVLDIMEFAAAEGLCPPVKTTLQTPAANRQEVVILDTDALRRLETYLLAKPDITGTGILISLHTGLRISGRISTFGRPFFMSAPPWPVSGEPMAEPPPDSSSTPRKPSRPYGISPCPDN